jgi:hypothetical protein
VADWEFEHSVPADVSRDRAWAFWTSVDNWRIDAAIEWVSLDGLFEAGVRGVTKSRGSEPVEWRIEEASPPARAVIAMDFPGAVVTFEWTFETEPSATRIRQRVRISGPRAGDYVLLAEAELVPNMPEGMRKLAEAMSRQEPRPRLDPAAREDEVP